MGFSQDYSNVPEWEYKDTGYHTGAMVKYQGNIFIADFWAQAEPGKKPKPEEGWALYDELYDVTTSNKTEQAKIIAYIPTWRKREGFDYRNDEMYRYITHGIISFLMFSEINLGEFDPNSVNDVYAILSDVVETGHRNGTRILIALGGATDYGFLNLMTSVGNNPDSPLLNQAVQNVVNFVNSNNLDGVDLDLECWWDRNGDPKKDQGGRAKSDGAHPAGYALTLFAQKLKQAMPNKLVSAAIFGTSWYGNNYDSKIVDYVDWLGIMTYDLTGSWNTSPVGPHTALHKIRNQSDYAAEQQGSWPPARSGGTDSNPMVNNPIPSVEDTLWYWTNPLFLNWQGAGQKIPRNKIAAGVPIYGYDFAYAKDKKDPQSGQITPGYKTISYKEILAQFPDAHTAANANIKVTGSKPRPPFISASGNYPYAHNIYFETPGTAVAKLNFLKDVGTQGVIIWELSSDVWEEGKSIIKALYQNSGNPQKQPGGSAGESELPPNVKKVYEAARTISRKGNNFAKDLEQDRTPEVVINQFSDYLQFDFVETATKETCEMFLNQLNQQVSDTLTEAKAKYQEIVERLKEYKREEKNKENEIVILLQKTSDLSDWLETEIKEENEFDAIVTSEMKVIEGTKLFIGLLLAIFIPVLTFLPFIMPPGRLKITRWKWEFVQLYQVVSCLHLNIQMEKFEFDRTHKQQNNNEQEKERCERNSNDIEATAKKYMEKLNEFKQKWNEFVNKEYSEIDWRCVQLRLSRPGADVPEYSYSCSWYYKRPTGEIEARFYSGREIDFDSENSQREKRKLEEIRAKDIMMMTIAVLGPIEEVLS